MSGESILLALIASLPGLIALVGTLRKDAAEAKKTGSEREQLENEITDKVLRRAQSEIDNLTARISALESDLSNERQKRRDVEKELEETRHALDELRVKDREREAAMSTLQSQFDHDTLLRANIEKALSVANDRITALEKERAELKQQLAQRDAVIVDLQNQITALKRGQTAGGLLKP